MVLVYFVLVYENVSLIEDFCQMVIVCKDMVVFYVELEDFKNVYEYQLLYDKFVE